MLFTIDVVSLAPQQLAAVSLNYPNWFFCWTENTIYPKMKLHNPGTELDLGWLEKVRVNLPAVKRRAETLGTKRTVKMQWQAAWLCRALTCIDLTTLSGDDTETNIQRLCLKAAKPIRGDIVEAIGMKEQGLTTGAVCVYPSRYVHKFSLVKFLVRQHLFQSWRGRCLAREVQSLSHSGGCRGHGLSKWPVFFGNEA